MRLLTPHLDRFEDLLEQNQMISINAENIQLMMVEVFSSLNKINPSFLWEEFKVNNCGIDMTCGSIRSIPRANNSRLLALSRSILDVVSYGTIYH